MYFAIQQWITNIQFSCTVVVVQSLSCVHLSVTPGLSPGLLVPHHAQSSPKFVSIESVMPSNHLILCCPLFHLPSIFPSIRVFSNELVIFITLPKYWGLSFSISLSNEYSGLISFSIHRFDLPEVQGTFKSPFQHHSLEASILTGRLTWGKKKKKQFDSYAPRSPGNRIPPQMCKVDCLHIIIRQRNSYLWRFNRS